jgi:hypothetical protein
MIGVQRSFAMQSQPNPPSGVEPAGKKGPGAQKNQGAGQSGPGGLSGGVDVGANAPGRTDRGGKQDN